MTDNEQSNKACTATSIHPELVRVIDVKGMRPAADASLRFALFRSKYTVPVYIARYDRKTGLFEEVLA